MVYCRTCQGHFSERKGTVLQGARLADDKARAVLRHIQEGCGTRATRRLVQVDKNTVTRYLALAGRTPTTSTKNGWLFPPQTRAVQVDDKWGFVGKKEQHCDPDNPLDRLRGDAGDHTAIDPESRLLLRLVPGKREGGHCQQLIQEVHQRTGGRTDLLITSAAPAPYTTAIAAV